MTNVPRMASVHEAYTELKGLGVIVSETADSLRLDVARLARLGYVLTFDGIEPIFTRTADMTFLVDCIHYAGDLVPRSSLRSYLLNEIKTCSFSP